MNLIFLHGSGCTRAVWEQQLSFFKGSFAPDLPGRPAGKALASVEELAEWLIGYIHQNELTDVVLVGHSLGAAISLQAALLENDLAGQKDVSHGLRRTIKGLVLIGAGGRLKVMPQLIDSLAVLAKQGSEIPGTILASNNTIPEPFKTRINQAIRQNGPGVMLADFEVCNQFDVMEQLENIQLPVKILVGETDSMTPVKYATFLKNALLKSELDIIKHGTHMVFAEQPDLVNHSIHSFIERISVNDE